MEEKQPEQIAVPLDTIVNQVQKLTIEALVIALTDANKLPISELPGIDDIKHDVYEKGVRKGLDIAIDSLTKIKEAL